MSPASPATTTPSTVSIFPPLALISAKTLTGFGTYLQVEFEKEYFSKVSLYMMNKG